MGHNIGDPLSRLEAVEAAWLAASMPRCPHCHDRRELIPMTGTAWGVETFHEEGCPDAAV